MAPENEVTNWTITPVKSATGEKQIKITFETEEKGIREVIVSIISFLELVKRIIDYFSSEGISLPTDENDEEVA